MRPEGRRGHPRQATAVSKRQPSTLFGAGLLAAIPDETLLALAAGQQGHPDGVAGRVNRVDDGIRQGEAGGSDWRTPPLWGLG